MSGLTNLRPLVLSSTLKPNPETSILGDVSCFINGKKLGHSGPTLIQRVKKVKKKCRIKPLLLLHVVLLFAADLKTGPLRRRGSAVVRAICKREIVRSIAGWAKFAVALRP